MPQSYIIAQKCDIISKIYHPFRQERISLKRPSFVYSTKEGLFMSVGYKKDIFAVFAYEFEFSQILNL